MSNKKSESKTLVIVMIFNNENENFHLAGLLSNFLLLISYFSLNKKPLRHWAEGVRV